MRPSPPASWFGCVKLVTRDQVQREESDRFVSRTFGGSLPGFVAAFLKGRTLSESEAEELKTLIDQHRG